MPKLSGEYLKQARTLIVENLERFIKIHYNDDRKLINNRNDKKISVVEREINGELKLLVNVSRTSFPATNELSYVEDFVALVVANVNGENILCKVDLKWSHGLVGGKIIPQFEKNFPIYRQEIHSGKKNVNGKMKKYYDGYETKSGIDFVEFDFNFNE